MLLKNLSILFLFFFLSKELFFFDEELLVVCSFFVIFFLLFFLIKSLILMELESRSAIVFNQFISYLNAKKDLLNLTLLFYKQRTSSLYLNFVSTLDDFSLIFKTNYSVYVSSLVYWSQRFIISKLLTIVTFENLYLKKEFLSFFSFNNMEVRINFFINNVAFK